MICFVRKYTNSYSPASIFTLFWTIQILVILIGWSQYLCFNYIGIIFILFCILSFDLGYLLTPRFLNSKTNTNRETTISFDDNIGLKTYYIVIAISIFSCLYDIISKGFSLINILDITSFMEMSHQNSIDRYTGESTGGLLSKLLGINSLACPFVGGLLYLGYPKKHFLSYIALLPAILSGLSQGAKMGIITSLFMWIIGYLISAQLFNIKIKFNLKKFLIISIVFIAFIMLMGVVMVFRIGEFNETAINDVIGKSVSYILAHLPAFDIWYSNQHESVGSYTMGAKLLYGISNILGILKREDGVYSEMTVVSIDGDVTNVYTVFRFFVEDFGTIGSIFFLFILGMIIRTIFECFKKRLYIYWSTTLMTFIYFFISWSFVTSVLAYTTYIITIGYIYILLRSLLNVHYSCNYSNTKKGSNNNF